MLECREVPLQSKILIEVRMTRRPRTSTEETDGLATWLVTVPVQTATLRGASLLRALVVQDSEEFAKPLVRVILRHVLPIPGEGDVLLICGCVKSDVLRQRLELGERGLQSREAIDALLRTRQAHECFDFVVVPPADECPAKETALTMADKVKSILKLTWVPRDRVQNEFPDVCGHAVHIVENRVPAVTSLGIDRDAQGSRVSRLDDLACRRARLDGVPSNAMHAKDGPVKRNSCRAHRLSGSLEGKRATNSRAAKQHKPTCAHNDSTFPGLLRVARNSSNA
mmetsp:Transcript_703/g.1504  ORF Transcript_703/g.1504 Transcript_703/m.1504 type:complete len:282 (+) Transcript_703:401-1246(+)